jgi:transcriptional regulator with XRE-family HTH domain
MPAEESRPSESRPLLAATIVEVRMRRQMSQRSLARALGVAPSAIGKWEKGTVPSPTCVPPLARWLGLTEEAVYDLAGPDRVRRDTTSDPRRMTPMARRRVHLRLSQSQIARRVPVSVATYSRWESGVRLPPPEMLSHLARALDMDAAALDASWPDRGREARRVGRLPGLDRVLSERGLSAEDVAKALDVDGGLARAWTQGKRALPEGAARAIEQRLGLCILDHLPQLRRRTPPPIQPEGSPLARVRRASGLSQAQLGALVAVSGSTISVWERSGHVPPRVLRPLTRVLRCSRQDLGGDATHPSLSNAWHQKPLAARLRELRIFEGLSQAALARCVGVTSGTVRRWEAGMTTPSPQRLQRLEAALFAIGCLSMERGLAGCHHE